MEFQYLIMVGPLQLDHRVVEQVRIVTLVQLITSLVHLVVVHLNPIQVQVIK